MISVAFKRMMLNTLMLFAIFAYSFVTGDDQNHVHFVCEKEANIAKHALANKQDRMNLALCFHKNNLISDALETYRGLRNDHTDYAFPLVNIAHGLYAIGKFQEAIDMINTYFIEVGANFNFQNFGAVGNLGTSDYDALVYGSPCSEDSSFRRDCVSALNLFGLSHVSLVGK